MECSEVQELIEEVAAGELAEGGAVAEHLATCRRCAASLALARQIYRVLGDPPQAPEGLVPAVMRRVRRERWRAEQYLDVGFNVAVAASLAIVAGGIWLLLHLTGLEAVASGTAELMAGASAEVVRRITPALPLYASAAGVFGTAVAIWWWVERDAT